MTSHQKPNLKWRHLLWGAYSRLLGGGTGNDTMSNLLSILVVSDNEQCKAPVSKSPVFSLSGADRLGNASCYLTSMRERLPSGATAVTATTDDEQAFTPSVKHYAFVSASPTANHSNKAKLSPDATSQIRTWAFAGHLCRLLNTLQCRM